MSEAALCLDGDRSEIAQDRMAEVARIILAERTGATLEEIVEAAKAGSVTEEQAVIVLEKQYRRQARHNQWRERPCGARIEALPDPSSLNEPALLAQAQNVLLRIINDLPLRQRQAVELYFFGGYTQDEIAHRLRVDRSTVRSHITRAVERIARCGGRMSPFSATSAGGSEAKIIALLMRLTYHTQKRHHPPVLPYQLWRRFNLRGYWADNGIYATEYVDKLPQYLEDCFHRRGIAIPRGA